MPVRQAQDERRLREAQALRQAQDDRILREPQDERRPGQARDGRSARSAWTPELGEAFLALVRETGNARASALALGHPNLFNNRMRRRPEFRRACRAAAVEADARWRDAESAFPRPPGSGPAIEYKSARLPTDAESLGGYLRPGRKRKQAQPEPVLRRNSQGRMQVSLAREGHWTSDIEADFLARLAATGNFDACARAVGFQPGSVKQRLRKWPAFERACEAALAEADVVLVYRLTAHAHALMRRPGEAEEAGIEEEEVPFDPVMAMKILAHIDARRYGRSGKGRRKGPPERTFQQAVESILAKIDAIERHEKLMKEREEAKEATQEGKDGGDGGAA